jgi:hypothetical protein
MPLYLFTVENGEPISGEAEELPDDQTARLEAELIARDLYKNQPVPTGLRVIATNEAGERIATIPLPWKRKQ